MEGSMTDKEWREIQINMLREQIEALEANCTVDELRERKFNQQCANAIKEGNIGWVIGAMAMREWEVPHKEETDGN